MPISPSFLTQCIWLFSLHSLAFLKMRGACYFISSKNRALRATGFPHPQAQTLLQAEGCCVCYVAPTGEGKVCTKGPRVTLFKVGGMTRKAYVYRRCLISGPVLTQRPHGTCHRLFRKDEVGARWLPVWWCLQWAPTWASPLPHHRCQVTAQSHRVSPGNP